jgi:hypothetical protein
LKKHVVSEHTEVKPDKHDENGSEWLQMPYQSNNEICQT